MRILRTPTRPAHIFLVLPTPTWDHFYPWHWFSFFSAGFFVWPLVRNHLETINSNLASLIIRTFLLMNRPFKGAYIILLGCPRVPIFFYILFYFILFYFNIFLVGIWSSYIFQEWYVQLFYSWVIGYATSSMLQRHPSSLYAQCRLSSGCGPWCARRCPPCRGFVGVICNDTRRRISLTPIPTQTLTPKFNGPPIPGSIAAGWQMALYWDIPSTSWGRLFRPEGREIKWLKRGRFLFNCLCRCGKHDTLVRTWPSQWPGFWFVRGLWHNEAQDS